MSAPGFELIHTTETAVRFLQDAPPGDIRFTLAGGEEVLRIAPDGKSYVRGVLVEDDPAERLAYVAHLLADYGIVVA